MPTVSTILNLTDIECFHHCTKSHWTVLVWKCSTWPHVLLSHEFITATVPYCQSINSWHLAWTLLRALRLPRGPESKIQWGDWLNQDCLVLDRSANLPLAQSLPSCQLKQGWVGAVKICHPSVNKGSIILHLSFSIHLIFLINYSTAYISDLPNWISMFLSLQPGSSLKLPSNPSYSDMQCRAITLMAASWGRKEGTVHGLG